MADENHFRGHSDKDQQYLNAAAWSKQEGKGAKAAIKTGKWPLISFATLQRRLNTGPLIQDKRALLTKDEEAVFDKPCPGSDWIKGRDNKCYKPLDNLPMAKCMAECTNSFSHGASILFVESNEENQYLVDKVLPPYSAGAWVGVFKKSSAEGEHIWSSTCGNNFTRWSFPSRPFGPQPRDWHIRRADCAVTNSHDGYWTAMPCDFHFQCVCQYPAMRNAPLLPVMERRFVTAPINMRGACGTLLAIPIVVCLWFGVVYFIMWLWDTIHGIMRAMASNTGEHMKTEETAQTTPDSLRSTIASFRQKRSLRKVRAQSAIFSAGVILITVGAGVFNQSIKSHLPPWIFPTGSLLMTVGFLTASCVDLNVMLSTMGRHVSERCSFAFCMDMFYVLTIFFCHCPSEPVMLLSCSATLWWWTMPAYCKLNRLQSSKISFVLNMSTAALNRLVVGAHADATSVTGWIMGCMSIIMAVQCAHSLRDEQASRDANSYFNLLYVWLTGSGFTVLGGQLSQHTSLADCSRSIMVLAAFPLLLLPPIVYWKRQFFGTRITHWFESSQRMEDGAVIAALLTEACGLVEVGQTWWVHKDQVPWAECSDGSGGDGTDADTHENFRPGRVILVLERYFIVRLADAESKDRCRCRPRAGRDAGLLSLDLPVEAKRAPVPVLSPTSDAERKCAISRIVDRLQLLACTTFRPHVKVSFSRFATSSPALVLADGLAKLRCVEWNNLSLELLTMDRVTKRARDADIYALGRPLEPDEEIDFFVSHSHYDDGQAKYAALQRVVQRFRQEHDRYPTFWIDAVCFDKRDFVQSLQVLPVNVQACKRLIVLCGPTYCTRMWCIWELYCVFAFSPPRMAAERVLLEPLDCPQSPDCAHRSASGGRSGTRTQAQLHRRSRNGGRNGSRNGSAADVPSLGAVDISAELSRFELAACKCYDPNEEHRIRSVIKECGEESFQTYIRGLGRTLQCAMGAAGSDIDPSRAVLLSK